MTITNGYATLAELKIYLTARGGNVATDTSDDSKMEDIVEAASRYIDGQVGRRFYLPSQDETRYYTAESDSVLFIDDLTSDPTSVKVDYQGTRTYGDTVATSDFDMLPANAALEGLPYNRLEMHWDSADYWPTSYRNGVQIIGKFGFATVPDDIKTACLAIALNIYNSSLGQSNAGNVSVTAAGVVVRPQDVPGWAEQTFAKYRRYV